MRRAQSNIGSQIIRNLAYNPSFESTNVSSILRSNYATNPSLETAGAVTAVRTNLLINPSAESSSSTVNTRTNLAINPSFEGTSGTTNVRTNLLVSPSMETGSGTVTTRTNLCTNPSFETATTGWNPDAGTGACTISTDNTRGLFGTSSLKMVGTNTNGDVSAFTTITLAASTTYTVSWYVYSTDARNQATFDVAGTGWNVSALGLTAIPATTWTRVSATFTTGSALTGASNIYLHHRGGPTTTGAVAWIDGVLIEQTSALGNYFDGTVAASENLVKGVPATMQSLTTATTGVIYSGQTWVRATTPTGPSANAGIVRQFVNLSDLMNGETYTTSVTVANDQAFSQSLSLDWCDLNYLYVTLAPGEVRRISVTASKSVYDSVYRFSDLQVTQSPTESRSILFKDWLVEKGTTSGEYYTSTGDFTYTWSGTAHASTGLQRATGVANWSNSSTASSYQSTTQKNVNGKSLAVFTRGGNGDGVYAADITAIAPGASYTFSAWIKQTTSHPLTMDFRWKDSGQAIISDSLVSIAPTVGQWTRVSATATAPTGSVAYLQPMIRIYAAHTGTTFFVDDALIERASAMGSYFDGTTPAAGDFTYVWSGAAHGSWSYQQAPTVATWINRWFGNSGGYGSFYQAKGGLSGTYARKLWTSANTGSVIDSGINLPLIAVSPSTPYTLSAWVRCSVAQNMNFYIEWKDSASASLGFTQQTTSTPIVANTWTRVSITATSPAGAASGFFVIGPYAQSNAMPYGATLDFDNVLIEASASMQDYFDGANPIQNLVTNPSFETDTSGWSLLSLNAGSGRASTRGYSGSSSCFLVATDNLGDSMAVLTSAIAVAPFASYTISAYVYVPAGVVAGDFRGGNRNLWAVSYDGVSQSTVSSANIDFTKTNQWQRLSCTMTIPAVSTGLSVRLYAPANALGVYWDAVMVEKTNVVNPYYEGTGDYSYVWSGTANASTSYQQAPSVTGATSPSYLSICYQSKTNGITSGTKSIRITPTHATSNDSFAELNGMISGYTFKPNTTYTISGNRTILASQTTTLGVTGFRVNIGGVEQTVYLMSPVANVAGTQRVVGRFTTGAATNVGFIRVYNGASFGGGDVWWDDVLLEEGTTNGTYFDGSNPIQNLVPNPSFDTNTSGWSQPNGSTVTVSTAQAYVGTQSALVTVASSGTSGYSGAGLTIPLAANTTYTFSGYVYIPATGGTPVMVSVQGTNFVSAGSTAVTATGGWKRISTTFTTNLAQNYALYFLNGAPSTAGQTFYLDAVMLERSAFLHPYYTGLGDFTYAWTGTANASSTEQRANLVADRQAVATNSTVYQSSVRAMTGGTKSGAIRVKNDVFTSGTLMYPVNEYFTGSGLVSGAYNTWSLWVWVPSGSGTVRLEDIVSGTIGSPNTTFDAWERISITFMGAAANTAHLLRLRAATTITAGTVIWWDNELVEASPAVQPYFDGSSGTTGDFTHAWAGTANASISRESALTVDGYSGSTAMAVVSSTDWSSTGARSLRIFPTTSSTDSFASATFTLETGKTYTMSANIRLTATQTGTLDGRARRIAVYHSNGYTFGTQAPNAVGVSRVSVTFKVIDGTQYQSVRLYNGASAGGGDVWWDDFMITEGTYTGDYVDGTKPLSKWDGIAQKSVSAGYPQQFLDLAGAPALQQIGAGSTSDVVVDGFGARTFYIVYEVTNDNSSSWTVPFMYGTQAPTAGFTLQTAAAGNFTVSPRLDFTSGGDINKGFNFPNGRALSRRHVLAISFPAGLTSMSAYGNGNLLSNQAINPGAIGWTSGALRNFSQSNIKAVHSMVFYTEHDSATKIAMSRYLGNKYGASVA